ncbi:MAG: 50S ribosomal protein L29 [Proteobacteria bacterium]|nr:50S ribosomal protein L29 [Cystobacterineae bacterium]MCL2258609.1 50S ribosomal protein L29 [Cystobacterineae bacterium]MCL2315031.1 50S ribosomal protein L29 [Pseudomonadota bacterium]
MATTKELRELTPEELKHRVQELREAVFHNRMKRRLALETDFSVHKKQKKELARILTVMNQKLKETKEPVNG